MMRKQKVQAAVTAGAAGLLAVLALSQKTAIGQEYYVVTVNGIEAGAVAKSEDVEALIKESRRGLMRQTTRQAYANAQIVSAVETEKGKHIVNGETLTENITELLKGQLLSAGVNGYTVTSENYSGNFATREEAEAFIDLVKDKTEGGNEFSLTAEENKHSEDDVMRITIQRLLETANGTENNEKNDNQTNESEQKSLYAGVIRNILKLDLIKDKDDEKYINQTGIVAMDFADNVYMYENYVNKNTLADVSQEAEEVTKEKETNKIYVVEAGDCLSTIAEDFDTTVDSIVAINGLSGAEAMVYADQELTVAVPKPDISLLVFIGDVYEEEYAAEPTIIGNDSWYTTQENVLQAGASGQREVNALITYEQGVEISREILHTAALQEAVPAVVERGTQIPPTYIKPLSGGRFTSGFKKRWGKWHKGLDWATPIGAPVYASSAGTVAVAGAVRGYGYAVYISHPDGRTTRYGHLSEVLVSPGQQVEQGDTIALSGNTGRSTGPHVHFEILIDGTQVNPLEYMN